MKIRWKIDLAIAGAFLVGLVLAGIGAYTILTRNALDDSLQNARIMIEGASAIRTYTAESIKPLLEQQMKVQFLPHSIPSYAAQTNFKMVHKKLPDYTYREPTLNPTNLNDRAVDWEADIINDFRNDAGKTELVTTRDTPAGSFLTLARPLKIGSPACLSCHSTPENAPPTMVALYGSQNGFGWKQGEVVGAQVVSIPLAVPLSRAYQALFWFMLILAGTSCGHDPPGRSPVAVARRQAGRRDLGDGGPGQHGTARHAGICPQQQGRNRLAFDVVQPDAAQPAERDEDAGGAGLSFGRPRQMDGQR